MPPHDSGVREIIHVAMGELASRRPIFHSESDWQFALASTLQRQHPDAAIRLEIPIRTRPRTIELDILMTIGGTRHALELKYPRAQIAAEVAGEMFELREGARDVDRFGIVKDVVRCERILAGGFVHTATALVLTPRQLWVADKPRATLIKDAAFQLHDGQTLGGTLDWDPSTAPTTREENPGPLTLVGRYPLSWRPYSKVTTTQNVQCELRYLAITASPAKSDAVTDTIAAGE